MPLPHPGARGATLIELIVFIALAAVIAALLVPFEALRTRLALHTAAAGLVGEIRAAQARALAERDPDRAYGVDFTPGDAYMLVAATGGVRTVIRTRRLAPGVRVSYARFGSGGPAVMFSGVSRFGAPSGGGTVSLSGGGARLCIRVLPATGRVRVARLNCP
jgi:type II secretory pathway pseudopilin PulG